MGKQTAQAKRSLGLYSPRFFFKNRKIFVLAKIIYNVKDTVANNNNNKTLILKRSTNITSFE